MRTIGLVSFIVVLAFVLTLFAALFALGARNWYRHGCLSVQGNSYEFCTERANGFITGKNP